MTGEPGCGWHELHVRVALMSEVFPFRGTLLRGKGYEGERLRGGKAFGVAKPTFPPRAPPFRARRCCTLRMCEYSDGAMYATMLKSESLSRFLRVSRQSNHSLSRTEGGLHSRPVPGTECKKRNFPHIFNKQETGLLRRPLFRTHT